MANYMLDRIEALASFFKSNALALNRRLPFGGISDGREYVEADGLFCPQCGDRRRVKVRQLYIDATRFSGFPGEARNAYDDPKRVNLTDGNAHLSRVTAALAPSLFNYECVQCQTTFLAVGYPGPMGPSLAVLPSRFGGFRTPHTHSSVAFYLDQAQRCASVGAYTAAMAMYRGALEQLLFHAGYKARMLAVKVRELDAQVAAGTAPKWAMELDGSFLTLIKQLGDGSIHPNDGDVGRQAALDRDALDHIQETFAYLLFLVYEVPHQKTKSLTYLSALASRLKK